MTTTKYIVTGMTCGHCSAAVTEEVSAISGVEAVEVDHESGSMVVTGSAVPDFAAVQAAVAEAGDYAVAAS